VAACAVCCAGPLLAVLATLGTAAAIGAYFIPALAALAVAAALGAIWLLRRRRSRASSCQVDAGVVHHAVDLGLPAPPRP
jgi:hypothetical protein